MELTAKQIKEIDEINFDKNSAESTLKIALQYHSNTLTEVTRKERLWWDEIISSKGLSRACDWKVNRTAIIPCIEKVEDENANR